MPLPLGFYLIIVGALTSSLAFLPDAHGEPFVVGNCIVDTTDSDGSFFTVSAETERFCELMDPPYDPPFSDSEIQENINQLMQRSSFFYMLRTIWPDIERASCGTPTCISRGAQVEFIIWHSPFPQAFALGSSPISATSIRRVGFSTGLLDNIETLSLLLAYDVFVDEDSSLFGVPAFGEFVERFSDIGPLRCYVSTWPMRIFTESEELQIQSVKEYQVAAWRLQFLAFILAHEAQHMLFDHDQSGGNTVCANQAPFPDWQAESRCDARAIRDLAHHPAFDHLEVSTGVSVGVQALLFRMVAMYQEIYSPVYPSEFVDADGRTIALPHFGGDEWLNRARILLHSYEENCSYWEQGACDYSIIENINFFHEMLDFDLPQQCETTLPGDGSRISVNLASFDKWQVGYYQLESGSQACDMEVSASRSADLVLTWDMENDVELSIWGRNWDLEPGGQVPAELRFSDGQVIDLSFETERFYLYSEIHSDLVTRTIGEALENSNGLEVVVGDLGSFHFDISSGKAAYDQLLNCVDYFFH